MKVASDALKIAVLVNFSPASPYQSGIISSFVDAFNVLVPTAAVDFYDPVVKSEFPDARDYDLVVLSGGQNVLSGEPWIENVLEFVRKAVEEQEAGRLTTKILGVCWGHQAIAIACGGVVKNMERGPIGGLETMPLTDAGKVFFPSLAEKGAFTSTQLHVRHVVTPAPHFIALAEDNEVFVSDSNAVFSIQAHPEIMGEFATFVMRHGNSYDGKGMSREQVEEKIRKLGGQQDGLAVLERILEWVREPRA